MKNKKNKKRVYKHNSLLVRIIRNTIYFIVGLTYLIYLILKLINKITITIYNKLPHLMRVGIVYSLVLVSAFGLCKEPKVITKVVTIEKAIVEPINAEENEQQNTNVKACNLSEIECFILDSAISQGLEKEQAYKILAISKHETGNWTSKIFIERHNFGGIIRNGKFESYENNEQGIKDMIHVLRDYYFARGKNTLEDIQKSYCPIGASNDPSGLNNYWLPRVTQYYNEYLKMEG
jgi:hypothetical protein